MQDCNEKYVGFFNMDKNPALSNKAAQKQLANLELKMCREKAVPQRRKRMCHQIIQKELDIEESLYQSKLQREIKNSQNEQDERLADIVDNFHKEKIAKEKHRLQLRQNSLELRELEKKIKTAYYCKERDAQLRNIKAKKLEEQECLKEENFKIQEEQKKNEDEQLQYQQQLLDEKLKYNEILARQLEEQEFLKQSQYEEHLRDKLMIDEIIRKIYEEDQRVVEDKKLSKLKLQKEMLELQKTRQLLRQKELERIEEENRKINEFNNMKYIWESKRQAEIRQKVEEMTRLQEKLREKLHQQYIEKLQLQIAREQVSLAEWEETQRQKAEEDIKYRFQQRLELKNRQNQEMKIRNLIKQRQHEEEEEFKRMMLIKLEEDENKEKANALIRYQQQVEYKQAIQKLLEDRKAQHILQIEEELKEIKELEDMEKKRIEQIEEEKLCLLKEHANNLAGYLDKGIISKEDLDKLGDEFKKFYV